MTLRKIIINNSLRYIPISEKTKEKKLNQKQRKLVHFLENKTKIFQKLIKIY